MTFKNYMKISFSNFDKTWKLVLYRIVVWAVICALMAPCFNPIKQVVTSIWDYDLFVEFAGAGLFFGKNIAVTFASVASVLVAGLTKLFTDYLAAGIYLTIVLFVIKPFLMNLGRFVVNEQMYGYMSSHAKHGFCSTFIRTLKKSSLYSVFRMLFTLPFNFAVATIFYFMLGAGGDAFAIAMPFVFLAIATIVLTIKQLLITGWAPAYVVSGENIFRSFGIGLMATLRGISSTLIFSLAVYFTMTLLALGFGVFSLIIIVPLFAIITSIYEMMNYFSCQGMRYYVDRDTVLSSKKLEEQDTISKAKFLL